MACGPISKLSEHTMSVTPFTPSSREDSRGLTEQSVTERIRILASQGLKPRDISSLLGVHPMIVIRLLERDVRVLGTASHTTDTTSAGFDTFSAPHGR